MSFEDEYPEPNFRVGAWGLRARIRQFRILMIGGANSGKTTILRSMLHIKIFGSPLILKRFDSVGDHGEAGFPPYPMEYEPLSIEGLVMSSVYILISVYS
jgi:hypothetical protein